MTTQHRGVPAATPGEKASTETSLVPGILKTFQEKYAELPWNDVQHVIEIISVTLPNKIALDISFRNAVINSGDQNARIEFKRGYSGQGVRTIGRDYKLLKQFADNREFREWMAESVYQLAKRTVEATWPSTPENEGTE